jgi:hypothetical protein
VYLGWPKGVHLFYFGFVDDHIQAFFVQVWHIRLTLHFLADAGNLLDCACLAGIVALKHFRKPDVEVIGDEVTVVCSFVLMHGKWDDFNRFNIISIFPLNVPQYPSPSIIHPFASLSHSSQMHQRLRLSIHLNSNSD